MGTATLHLLISEVRSLSDERTTPSTSAGPVQLLQVNLLLSPGWLRTSTDSLQLLWRSPTTTSGLIPSQTRPTSALTRTRGRGRSTHCRSAWLHCCHPTLSLALCKQCNLLRAPQGSQWKRCYSIIKPCTQSLIHLHGGVTLLLSNEWCISLRTPPIWKTHLQAFGQWQIALRHIECFQWYEWKVAHRRHRHHWQAFHFFFFCMKSHKQRQSIAEVQQ